ncbi:MAG: FixH family protein [Planctomycetota bacterium]|nr:FixH family protein [Planctomycetota bacterium]
MKSGRIWILIVVAFLTMNVCIGGALIYFAHSDPGFAVEENYYERALKWDDQARLRSESEALGWTVELDVPRITKGSSEAPILVRVRLVSREGEPVAAAGIGLRAFHVARARNRLEAVMIEVEPGHYAAPLLIDRAGWWEFSLLAERGDVRFAATERVFVREQQGGGAS